MSVKLPSMAAGTVLLGVFLSPITLTTAAGQTGGVATITNQAGAASTPVTQAAVKAAAFAMDSAGWTLFKKSADTRVIYVSSSAGDDRNDGLSESRPKKTIAAGYALLRSGSPDWLLLKRGDSWTTGFPALSKSGRSVKEMMLLGAYGAGAKRPRLQTGGEGGVWRGGASVRSVDFVALVGLEFTPHTRQTAQLPTGFSFIGQGSNLLIEGNLFSGYMININLNGYDRTLSSVTVRRNVIVDAWSATSHAQGIYADKVDGLVIEENVLDHNGWSESVPGAERTIFNHNMYLKASVTPLVVKNNVVCRGAATGIQMRGAGLAQGNVSLENPIGISLGHTQSPFPNTMVAVADANVVFDGGDIGAQPRGFAFSACNLAEARFTNNLVLSNTSATKAPRSWWVESLGQGVKKLVIEGNRVDGWGGPICIDGTRLQMPSVLIRRNQFRERGRGSKLVQLEKAEVMGSILSESNRFSNTAPAAQWFGAGPGSMSLVQWKAAVKDSSSLDVTQTDTSAAPTLERFAQLRRLAGGSRASVYAALRAQAPGAWRTDLSAASMASYMRNGK